MSSGNWRIVDSLQGVQLGEVNFMAADSSLIVFVDNSLEQVVGLDRDLRPLWRFGRPGNGPGEFGMIRSISIDDHHRVLLADERNRRLTWLSDSGTLLRSVHVEAGGGLVASAAGGAVLLFDVSNKAKPVAELDSAGAVLRRLAVPWPGFELLPDLVAGNVRLIGSPDDSAFVVGFMVGDGWFGQSLARGQPTLGRYVEHLDFPEVVETATRRLILAKAYALQDGFLEAGILHVLWNGADTSTVLRLIDRYAVRSGEYLGSWRLPRPATAIAQSGDALIAVFVNGEPTLVRLRQTTDPVPSGERKDSRVNGRAPR